MHREIAVDVDERFKSESIVTGNRLKQNNFQKFSYIDLIQ